MMCVASQKAVFASLPVSTIVSLKLRVGDQSPLR